MPRPRLTVKVWCLPRQTEEQIKSLHQALVEAVVRLEIGVNYEDDMIFLFPQDLMEYGLGSEIHVEVSNVPSVDDASRYPRYDRDSDELKINLGMSLKEVLQQRFPSAHVQGCFLFAEAF